MKKALRLQKESFYAYMHTFALCLATVLLLSGCGGGIDIGPKKEVSAYAEKGYELQLPADINIAGDYGSIEIFTSGEKELKYEATYKIRGTGEREELTRKLEEFELATSVDGSTAMLQFRYKGSPKNPADTRVELKVYIPRKTARLALSLSSGKIKVYDDINCELSMVLGTVNTEINKLDGKITAEADMGDIRIGGGRLHKESEIKLGMGNIRIKSEPEEGSYAFKTGLGNIELDLPGNTGLTLLTAGNVRLNEFETGAEAVLITAESEMGEIIARKYDVHTPN